MFNNIFLSHILQPNYRVTCSKTRKCTNVEPIIKPVLYFFKLLSRYKQKVLQTTITIVLGKYKKNVYSTM